MPDARPGLSDKPDPAQDLVPLRTAVKAWCQISLLAGLTTGAGFEVRG